MCPFCPFSMTVWFRDKYSVGQGHLGVWVVFTCFSIFSFKTKIVAMTSWPNSLTVELQWGSRRSREQGRWRWTPQSPFGQLTESRGPCKGDRSLHTWLTSLPLVEHSFALNDSAFMTHYSWSPTKMASKSEYIHGNNFQSNMHSPSRTEDFQVSGIIRFTTWQPRFKVCNDVRLEPKRQPWRDQWALCRCNS